MLPLLKTLVLPPAGPLLLALAGLVAIGRGKAWGRCCLWLGLSAAWLLSASGVVEPLARALAGSQPAAQTLEHAQALRGRADAVVLVLGGGVREGTHADGGYDLKPLTAERLRRGQWWAQHLQLGLAFTGGRAANAEPDSPTEATVVARVLAEAGQSALVWSDDQAADTRGNASFSTPHLRQHGTRHVLLVTHALHMPRALQHFQRAAPDVQFVPAPIDRPPGDDWRLDDWLPSADGAARGAYLVYEVVARLGGH